MQTANAKGPDAKTGFQRQLKNDEDRSVFTVMII